MPADPLKNVNEACSKPDGDCDGRTHFTIHQTVDGNLTKAKLASSVGVKRAKSHGFLLKSGMYVPLWPFSEKRVWATKAESGKAPLHGSLPAFPLKGKAINIEVDYEENGAPNDTQYSVLAGLYVDACLEVGRILTIVPHIEVDRGIRGGHNDPQNFDYNLFYGKLKDLGIDLSRVPRFDHDRYWGKPNFKIPFDTDTFHWPPILKGNPH